MRLCPISLQLPVIQKMDASLSSLKKCKHLRLSTNSIDKITGLNGMECLTILSIGRNQIKSVAGLEAVQDTPEEVEKRRVLEAHVAKLLKKDPLTVDVLPVKVRAGPQKQETITAVGGEHLGEVFPGVYSDRLLGRDILQGPADACNFVGKICR